MGEAFVIILAAVVGYIVGYEQGEADGINKQNKYWPERGRDDDEA